MKLFQTRLFGIIVLFGIVITLSLIIRVPNVTQVYAVCPTTTTLTTSPMCQFKSSTGVVSDRVNVSWNKISGATSYSLRWWFTDKNSSGTSTYNQCYLPNWFSGTSAGLDSDVNTDSKYAHIREDGWHCWPTSLASTTGGIGFAVYGNNSTCLIYKSNIAAAMCSTKPTAIPSSNPTPSLTTPPPHDTILNIALQLPGIGIKGNLHPLHTTRTVHLTIYANNVDPTQPNVKPLYDNPNVSVQFDSNSGFFLNSNVDIGSSLPTSTYQIFFKTPGYLRKQVLDAQGDKTFPTTADTINVLPSVMLIPGDVAPVYNVMDVSDFYAIVGCYNTKANTSSCTAGSQITDLNDDGVIDGVDINLWLSGFQTLLNNNNTSGAGDGAPGN
jgi:hypothetical protein